MFGSCSQGFAVRKAARDASHRGTSLSHETREPYLKARFQANGGDRCHLNLNSRSRKTLKPLMFVFLFSGTLTSWCSANYTLFSPWSAYSGTRFIMVCREAHSTHLSSNTEWVGEPGAKQSSPVIIFIITTFRCGQGHAGRGRGVGGRPSHCKLYVP